MNTSAMKKPSAYGAKMYNRYTKALDQLKDKVAACRTYKCSSSELFAAIVEVRDSVKLPPYYRGLLEGYGDALRDAVWRNDVRWVLYLDGEVMASTTEISMRADAAEKLGMSRSDVWNRVQGRHEWIGTNKPFTDFDTTTPTQEVNDGR